MGEVPPLGSTFFEFVAREKKIVFTELSIFRVNFKVAR